VSRLVNARALPLVAVAVLAAWLGWRATLTNQRFLDADELVHLNGAWFVSQGETMYLSFFENHPPFMAALLQPVVRSSDAPEVLIERGRWLMFGLTLAILLATAGLARRADGTLAAALAPALLASHTFFFQKTLEIRPDVPALLLYCLALLALARAVAAGRFGASLLAGALLCAAGLFTPKLIYAAGGACAAAALAASASPPRDARRGLRVLAGIALGGAALAGLACAEMARRGMLAGFLGDALAQSLRITIDDPRKYRGLYLATTLRVDAALWAAAVAGAWLARRRFARPGAGVLWILAGSFLGGGIGLFALDAPLRQAFLPLLPAAAVFGALALAAAARAIAARQGPIAAAGALALALLAFSAAPVSHLARTSPPMDEQLGILEQVMLASAPGERVFDCFSGLYLTRGHAYRYFYINTDLRRLFAAGELERDLAAALDAPDVKLVLLDGDCRKLPAALLARIQEGFAPLPSGGGLIWARKAPRPTADPDPAPPRG
jgi:4-amino-4-deoxy-L-arabinose transferase-like glycosyltransferase